MTGKNMLLIEVLLLSATWHTVSTAADTSIDFEKQIAPIFADHCVRCHSPGDRKGDVSLATIADLGLVNMSSQAIRRTVI